MVDASILYSIFEDTSTGVGRLGRWSGIGKAIVEAGRKGGLNQCHVSHTVTVEFTPRSAFNLKMLNRVLLLLATMAIFHGV